MKLTRFLFLLPALVTVLLMFAASAGAAQSQRDGVAKQYVHASDWNAS